MRSFVPSVFVSMLFSSIVAACGGSGGDACQINDDCSSALVCCKSSPSAPLVERGSCAATCMFVVSDASVSDASARDSGAADARTDDASTEEDASSEADATLPDDAAPAVDASEPDAETAIDASEAPDAEEADAS